MQKLIEMRERLRHQIVESERATEALRNELKGLEAAIVALGGSEAIAGNHLPMRRRRNVKATTMDLIVEAGSSGITAPEVVERAAAKGHDLHAGSVSSLLSRLKKEGTLTFDGERYFPKSAATPSRAASLLATIERAKERMSA